MSGERILVVDDEPDIRRLVGEILEDEGYRVDTVEDAASARSAVNSAPPQLVLLDIWLPDTDGLKLLKDWSVSGRPEMPVVMMSGHGNVETAVEATRLGAYDFIEKPVTMAKLLVTVSRALQTERLRQENLRLRSGVQGMADLIGSSQVMQDLRKTLSRVASTETWVLITGEPGSGKAVAARYLHRRSARGDRSFIEVSLGAIPQENIPMQLFGNEIGGEIIPGSFEQASGGTLLLDEIGDLDLDTQKQLLNTLEEGKFLRVGGKQSVPMDVRILAVTNQDLEQAVKTGHFREDLFYRLNVVPVRIPPLREHLDDLPDLFHYYLDWFCNVEGLPHRKFTDDAISTMRTYGWPGNVRELRNLIQRLLILHKEPTISAEELGRSLSGILPETLSIPENLYQQPLREARDQFEKAYLEHNLEKAHGNVSRVADIAGMERTHLYRKMKSLGLQAKRPKKK